MKNVMILLLAVLAMLNVACTKTEVSGCKSSKQSFNEDLSSYVMKQKEILHGLKTRSASTTLTSEEVAAIAIKMDSVTLKFYNEHPEFVNSLPKVSEEQMEVLKENSDSLLTFVQRNYSEEVFNIVKEDLGSDRFILLEPSNISSASNVQRDKFVKANLEINRDFKEVVAELNTRCYHGGVPTDALTICATNKQAEEVNRRFYDAIKAPEKTYIGKMKGKFPSTLPVEQEMRLKIGMKVMITSNDVDPTHKVPYYVNGTRATVVKFKTKSVVVELEDGTQVEIEPRLWENNEYKPSQRYNIAERKMEKFIERVVIGSYEQLPLKSGYAVTSHKSQGLTLDCYNLDLGKNGAFSPGMTYVALSRVKTIQGINLLRPLREVDIIVDPRVVEFYNTTFPGLDEKVRKDFETRVEKGDV